MSAALPSRFSTIALYKFIKTLLLFCLVLIVYPVASQTPSYLSPQTDFRSSANPFYWKNKLPRPGYWQQDVHYYTDAAIDDEKDVIDGSMKLVYYNNSPYALKELFFHLHQNAFQPNSYYYNLNIHNKIHVKFGKYEGQGLGTLVDSVRVNEQAVLTQLDNTILKVFLHQPLASGDSLTVTMKFKTFYDQGGTMRRRMKEFVTMGTKHYDGVQWYPALAVYDHKFGWETEQDLDKEYYGDFGAFDVRLTFAQ